MSDLEKIKKHLGRPIPISITNPDGVVDVFSFKPLNIEQQAIFMEISKTLTDRPKIKAEVEEDGKKVIKEFPDIKKDDMNEIFSLIKEVVKDSIEGLDEETLDDFCNTNFDQLLDAVFKLVPESHDKKDLDSLKEAKERMQSGK